MANTTPTKISFFQALRLCWLVLFAPRKFQQAQAADNLLLNAGNSGADQDTRHLTVRRAFLSSLLLVVASALCGFVFAHIAAELASCSSPKGIAWLQVVGACLLLWGTLFVRGWDVQTVGGVSLTERVNHWLYRGLYCFGTAIIVFSLVWPACRAAG